MLQQETLPLKLMAPCFDLLRELSAERDLIRLVVEIVQELRTDDNEDPRAIIAVSQELSIVLSHSYSFRKVQIKVSTERSSPNNPKNQWKI